MPGLAGGGLPDAEQIITADASGYLRALDEIIKKNQDWISKTREMQGEADKWQRTLDQFMRNMPQIAVKVDTDDGFDRRAREMQAITDRLADTALKANEKMAQAWDSHADSVHEVAQSYEHAGDSLGDFRQHVQDGGSQVRNLSRDMAELGRNAERTAAAIERVTSSGWTPEALAAAARANAERSAGASMPARYYGGPGGGVGDFFQNLEGFSDTLLKKILQKAQETGAPLGGRTRDWMSQQGHQSIQDALDALEARKADPALGRTVADAVKASMDAAAKASADAVSAAQDRVSERLASTVPWQAGVQGKLAPGDNPLLQKAIDTVVATRDASIRALQDQLDVSYRVARNVASQMQDLGVISPPKGRGLGRDVLAQTQGDAGNLLGTAWPDLNDPAVRAGYLRFLGSGATRAQGSMGGGVLGVPRSGPGAMAGGDGSMWPAFAGGVFGGGGGGGGDGGGGGGFFGGLASGGAFDMGRAASESLRVGNFIKQWYGVAHWVMMLSNELLATVGPATVAAGMAGLVGMQGMEQLVPRSKAIFATAESLGPSLGITAGQAFGLKNAPLQTAQDLATGASFGLTGAVVNSLRAGAGNAFVQLGSNTVAMFSRFAATMTQEFQNGLGKQLGNIVSGGTGYLQQLGDVLGNIGHVFLNVAPNLPGVGGDILSTLQGATSGLAAFTGWAGPLLGPGLAFEAGARYGPTLVGGAARGLSKASFGLLGTVARKATKADIGVAYTPEGVLVAKEGETVAGRGLAGAMGALGAADIGALAASAYVLTKGATYQTNAQQTAAATMQAIGQMGFAQGVPAILAAMQAAGKVPAGTAGAMGPLQENLQGLGMIGGGIRHLAPRELWQGLQEATGGGLGLLGGLVGIKAGGTPSNYSVAQQQLQTLAGTMVNALGAGERVANVWKGLTGQTIGMSKAFDVATMAQLQLGNAFEKNGHLTGQAKQMIANLQAGYQAMNFSGGQFGGAVGAQTAMAGLQHTQLAAVNQAYDQLTQMVQGGAAGASTFFGMLGGTPVTRTRGGIRFPAVSKGDAQFAQALGSFTTAGGAAAWNALTNQQTGLFPAMENQMNWLRTAQVMGALSPGQTTSMAGFEIAQAMSKVGNNPAALAMLSTYAQQFGGPGFAVGASGKDMRKGLADWIKQSGIDSRSFNKLMTQGTEGMANIGVDAQHFVQQIGSGIVGGLAQSLTVHGGDLQNKFFDSILHAGGTNVDMSALRNYATFMAHSGIPLKGQLAMGQDVGKMAGASQSVLNSIQAMIKGENIKVKVQADTSAAQAAIAHLTHVSQQPHVTVKAEVAAAQAAINAIKGKDVPVSVRAAGIAAVQAAIDSIHGKNVTVVITTINRIITQAVGAGLINTTGGFSLAGTGSQGMRIMPGHASGYRVPGYGGGDRHLALLEGGEAVVPKHLTAAVAPFLSMHNVPGFAAGGFVGQASYGPGAYWGMNSKMALWNPALLAQLLAAMQAAQGGAGGFPRMPVTHPMGLFGAFGGGTVIHSQAPHGTARSAGSQFAVEVLSGMKDGIKKAEAHKLAAELIAKLEKEVQYATGVANAAAYGQGFDPTGRGSGIFGGMTFTNSAGLTAAQLHSSPTGNIKDYNAYVAAFAAGDPGQAPKSAQDQMKSYLGTLKSFGGDVAKLRKEHLNKDVMAQIIAAGPEQGDQIAKSILGGKGGAGAVNKLWKDIQKASKGLGAQAAMAQYGGQLSQDLKHGQVSIGGVTINVSVGGGKGGTLELTREQIAQIVAQVQAALLKQAKKNNKTGIKAHGKGA